MKKILISIILAITCFSSVSAQEVNIGIESTEGIEVADIQPSEFYKGRIIEIKNAGDYQKIKVRITEGDEKGRIVNVEHGKDLELLESQKYETGEYVSVVKNYGFETSFNIAEPYRLNSLYFIVIIFLAIVFIFMRWKGLRSLLGLAFSILVLVKFVVPQIINGQNPLLISFIGSLLIAGLSIYFAHGFNRRSTLSIISTLGTIVIALVISVFFVSISKLFGTGTEEAFILQIGMGDINLKGLLLGGIVIGTLGILDDVTTSQTAVVEEIHKANPKLNHLELYKRGSKVGREHMISMINTLALAYIGAALPMFILFYTSENLPTWVILNNEMIVEEIVRTLAGSIALVFAVPISTILAAYSYSKRK